MAGTSPHRSPPVFAADIGRLLRFIDRVDLADEIGLDRAVLDDREGKVPVDLWYDVVEAASEASGDDFLGLHFGNHTQTNFRDSAGAMRLLLLSSDTVRISVDRAWRYQRYWNEAERYEIEEYDGLFAWRYGSWGALRPAHVQLAEKMAAHVVLFVRWASPGALPAAIRFAHARRAGDEEVARVLCCEPSYNGSWGAEVVFPSSVLDARLPTADEILFSVLDRQVAERLRDLSAVVRFSDRARKTIADYLHREELTIDVVARVLGTSGRTLQRRLNDERTSFRDLMDEVRRSRALAAIDRGASTSELVLLLGYSEETTFYRAFRRWTGGTPEAWRAHRGNSGGASPADQSSQV
jgi:AraC-like DNA-binding protein